MDETKWIEEKAKLTAAKLVNNKAQVEEAECKLLHEQEISLFAKCTLNALNFYKDHEFGATGWDSYPQFIDAYYWCFETMHLDGVLEMNKCGHLGLAPEPAAIAVHTVINPTDANGMAMIKTAY